MTQIICLFFHLTHIYVNLQVWGGGLIFSNTPDNLHGLGGWKVCYPLAR